MGYYINPEGESKISWLEKHGLASNVREVRNCFTERWEVPWLPVCLVDKGFFLAAGICYSPAELEAFIEHTSGEKRWFKVPYEDLKPWLNT